MSLDQSPPKKPVALPPGSAFGEQLRKAREARGISLEALAEATRISRHHLEALEHSDLDALPPGPFGKGYVRSCAKALGIESEPILESYRALETHRDGGADSEQRMLQQMSRLLDQRGGERASPRVARRTLALAAIGLVAAAGLGWSWARGWGRRAAPSRVADSSAASPTPSPRGSVESSPAAGARPESRGHGGLAPAHRGDARRPATVETRVPAAAAATTMLGATKGTRPATRSTDEIEVPEHAVGRGLADHQLIERSTSFPEGTTVTFWTLVVGGQRGQVVRHVWFRDGRAIARADLPLGSRRWRTFSRLRLPGGSAGPWAVEVRTSDGRPLARDEFVCTPR